MKILYKNLKKGEVRVKVENPEDLWYLSNTIDPGDLIRGHTIRKIKVGAEEQRKIRIDKKKVYVTIKTEKVEFKPDQGVLRVLGIIVEAPDLVQKGSHHTFNLEENSTATIIKESWLRYQADRLQEAATLKPPKIVICVLDREKAYFAKLKRNNYEVLSKFEGAVEKKAEKTQAKGNFYADVIKQLNEYDSRYKLDSIVVASPAFFKEDLMKNLKDEELREKIVLATCSSATETLRTGPRDLKTPQTPGRWTTAHG